MPTLESPPRAYSIAGPVHATPKPRLVDQLRNRIRFKHHSIRTEQAHVDWVRRFVLFHANDTQTA